MGCLICPPGAGSSACSTQMRSSKTPDRSSLQSLILAISRSPDRLHTMYLVELPWELQIVQLMSGYWSKPTGYVADRSRSCNVLS